MRKINRFLAATMACLLIMSLLLVHPSYALAEYEEQQETFSVDESGATEEDPMPEEAPMPEEPPAQEEPPAPEPPTQEETPAPEEPAPDENPTPEGEEAPKEELPLPDGDESKETDEETNAKENREKAPAAVPFALTYKVQFLSWDDTPLGEPQYIEAGLAASAPEPPSREGFRFTGWSDDFSSVTQDMVIVAQYEELDSYTITINYIFANNTPALQPVVYSVAEGDSFIRTIDSPVIDGYTPNEASLVLNLTDIQENYLYTVIYTPAGDTPYKVEYYIQDLVLTDPANPAHPDNFTLEETVNLTGQTAALVTAATKSYTGFSPPAKMPSAQIAANGSTVLKVYYTRNQYAIYFNSAGGSYVAPIAALYQEPITAPAAPTRAGYVFGGWSETIPTTMPAGDLNLTASWTTGGNVDFTYVYWLENINSTGYDYVGTSTGSATAGTVPSATGTVPSGVSFPIASTRYTFNSTKTNSEKPAAVNGDGTTIVNLYYDRNEYTLKFTFNATKYQLTVGGATYTTSPYLLTAKYGAPIADKWPGAPALKTGQTGDGAFVGWTGGSTNYVTKQYNLSDTHISASTFAATWSSSTKNVTVNYLFQNLSGSGYTLGDYQVVAVQSNSTTWNSKAFVGFTAEKPSAPIPSNNVVNFQYTRNKYSVTYYNGGTIARTTPDVFYQKDISDLGFTPTRPDSVPEGYQFDGWYTTAQGFEGSKFTFAGQTMPANNLILYAHWVKPQYTVTFDPDNGDPVFTQTVYALETASEPTPPTKPGFVFGGWYRQGSSLHYVFNFPVNGDISLTARWIAENNITYDVVHIKDGEEYLRQCFGGNAVGDTVTAFAISIPGYLPDALSKSLVLEASGNEIVFYYQPFTEAGYTVRYVDTNGNSLLPDKQKTTEQASVTENYVNIPGYYPDYYQQTLQLTPNAANNIITFTYTENEPVQYTVRILQENVEGGYTIVEEYTDKAAPGSTVTIPPPSYTGFTYQPDISSNSRVVASNGTTLLRLYYARNLYTVNFDTEGNGSLVGQTSFASIRYGSGFGNVVTVPVPLADRGYKFVEWRPAIPNPGDTITASATYTAVFEKDATQWATVTLDGNGADTGETFEKTDLLVGDTYTLPPNPFTRDDYDFAFWDTDQTGIGASYLDQATFTVTGDLYLYAQWSPEDKYTVAYLNNGATGEVFDPAEYEDGDKVTVRDATAFTYPGYTFVEWRDIASGDVYDPGDTFFIHSNVTFEAQWEKDPGQWATIVYDKNSDEATGTMKSEEVLVNRPHTLAPNQFERANNTFTGWNTKPGGGGDAYGNMDTITPVAGGELTLYAQWDGYPKFDITYHANNLTGDTVTDIEAYAGVPHTVYPADTFTYEYHDFVRWSTDGTVSGTAYLPGSSVYITEDLDLFAYWDERDIYTVTYKDGYTTAGVITDQVYADEQGLLDFTVAENPFFRIGYDFKDWLSDIDTVAYPRAVILDMNRNMEFTAEWTAIPYNITYELDGGYVNGNNPTVYNIETPTFELVNPTRPGYIFTGWTGTTVEQATEEVIIGQGHMGDLTYTAHWERDDTQWVSITFVSEDENKGTLEGALRYEGIIGEDINVTRLVSIAYPQTLPAQGYEFTAWSDEIPAQFPDEDMIITAFWRLLVTSPGSIPDGSGPTGSGPTGSGPTGSGPTGSGPTGSGPTGSGPAGSGPDASGPAASGPAGSGPDASGPAGSGPASAGPGGGTTGSTPEEAQSSSSGPRRFIGMVNNAGGTSGGSGSNGGSPSNGSASASDAASGYGAQGTGNNATGDTNRTWVWLTLMLAAAAGFAALWLKRKRGARSEKKG